jgi:hypothetical protein
MPSDKNSQKNFRMPEVLFFFPHIFFLFLFCFENYIEKERQQPVARLQVE